MWNLRTSGVDLVLPVLPVPIQNASSTLLSEGDM